MYPLNKYQNLGDLFSSGLHWQWYLTVTMKDKHAKGAIIHVNLSDMNKNWEEGGKASSSFNKA